MWPARVGRRFPWQPRNSLRARCLPLALTADKRGPAAFIQNIAMLNAFSVDVEDYYQVSAFERSIPRSTWGDFESRVVVNTQRLLDILAEREVTATFFILGWIADRFPKLIREIVAGGHEIGSHSYWHRLIYEMSPGEFRDDLRRSIRVIEDAGGTAVRCFRAPSFSITRRSLWALDVLVEEGIQVDSSIFPVRHDRYGIPNANPFIHTRETASGTLTEFPPTTVHRCGIRLPVGGGGYFRLYPLWFTKHCLRRINGQQRPFMFYVHPWELDPDQPRLRAATGLKAFRHRVNLSHTETRLRQLIRLFRFGTMGAAIRQQDKAVLTNESPGA
jgi:polysaccharide deacetylase family protein (PEP-CTERM system associated)